MDEMEDYITMTPAQWESVYPYFTPDECGSTNMDWEFMQLAYRLRRIIGPMVIHCGYSRNGHAPKSYHYSGQAIDFHAPESNFRITMAAIDHLGFGGCGWYPCWNHKGFHIDNRPHDIYQRWISPRSGEYEYLLRG